MTMLERAIVFATKAHQGVNDKGGKPYILHPLRVMLQMDTEIERAVAMLHDVVEDTHHTLSDIETLFGPEVRAGVDAMTRRKDETYFDYIRRVKLHPVGRKVKLADTRDNMSPVRLAQLPPSEQGVVKRYEKAVVMLLVDGDGPTA